MSKPEINTTHMLAFRAIENSRFENAKSPLPVPVPLSLCELCSRIGLQILGGRVAIFILLNFSTLRLHNASFSQRFQETNTTSYSYLVFEFVHVGLSVFVFEILTT